MARMTRMLASVWNAKDAQVALAGGVDILDLAAPDIAAMRALAAAAAGRAETSAACGGLPMEPQRLLAAARDLAAAGADHVRIAFPPSPAAAACGEALAGIAGATRLVAVLPAGEETDLSLLPLFARNGFYAVMADTAAGERLLDRMPPEAVARLAAAARVHGLAVGLAGALEAPDVPRLLRHRPDFLGFDSALRDREGAIRAEAVDEIRALIPREGAAAGGEVDFRLLAARGYAPAADPALGTDRIFVRDLVLPVEIGAYSHEHGHAQKVRFDVEADVLRVAREPEDMRHVFSYDVIIDGIRSIVAEGHVQLSETLAERIAGLVLDDPRVMRVTVRVEKLEVGPGGVGVEIERRRADQQASAGQAEAERGPAVHTRRNMMP